MADLNDIQATDAVRIVGAGLTGLEATPVNSSTAGELFTRDLINTSLLSGAVSLTTTATAVRIGASNLSGRKLIIVIPVNGTIYWGYNNGVTSSNGMPLFKNQRLVLSLSDSLTIFAVAATGTVDVRIVEGA